MVPELSAWHVGGSGPHSSVVAEGLIFPLAWDPGLGM